MRRQQQPNSWSCLATSFAMVLDIPLKQLIEECGHDGSAIHWPSLGNPFCRRGFHIQELIRIAYNHGVGMVPFEAKPTSRPPMDDRAISVNVADIWEIMEGNIGVLIGETCCGNGHAMAWNGRRVFDPSGIITSRYDLHNRDFLARDSKIKSTEKEKLAKKNSP